MSCEGNVRQMEGAVVMKSSGQRCDRARLVLSGQFLTWSGIVPPWHEPVTVLIIPIIYDAQD